MTISNANVGIGTTTPTTALVVVGDVSATNVTLTGRIITGDATSNKLGGITLDTNNITTTGRIITGDATSNKLGGITLDTNNITTTGRIITGSGGSNTVGGVILSNTQIITTGAINTGDATSNKIGGISLDTNNLWVPGLITGTTDNTSNKIGGVVLSNTRVGIGVANPGVSLDIAAGNGNNFRIANTNALILGNTSAGSYGNFYLNGYLAVYKAGTTDLATSNKIVQFSPETGAPHYLLSNNLGIRTTTPTVALDVAGDISGANMTLTGRITTGSAISNTIGGVLMSNGFLRPGAGIASAPGFAFLTDVCSGIFSGGTDIINIGTAGSNRFTVFGSNVGIGTVVPNYRLDVSTAAGTAAVNMNTWPRSTTSLCWRGKYAGSRSGDALFLNTTTTMDSNLITVADNCGTYFTVRRTGIYAITCTLNGSTTGTWGATLDVCTNIGHNTLNYGFGMLSTTGAPNGVGTGTLAFTGPLESNDARYYKFKIGTTNTPTVAATAITVTFLGENILSNAINPFI
jgi:hypothetical protein